MFDTASEKKANDLAIVGFGVFIRWATAIPITRVPYGTPPPPFSEIGQKEGIFRNVPGKSGFLLVFYTYLEPLPLEIGQKEGGFH